MKFKPVYTTRQYDIIPPTKQGLSIKIIGAGAIGSFTALALTKMGYGNIEVYDFDTIDEENMNCQFYPISSIGQKKVVALKELIKQFSGFDITVHDEEVTADKPIIADIVISAVDSMEVRKMIATGAGFKFLIDPRMGAEYATMNVIPPEGRDNYLKTLYTDEEAVQARCTAKSTMYTVTLIAGQVAKAVKDITLETNYISSLDWHIGKNELLAFDNEFKRL